MQCPISLWYGTQFILKSLWWSNSYGHTDRTVYNLAWGIPCSLLGALYETKKFDNLRFNEALSIGEDTLFFFEALCKCSKIAFIKERPYYYVQHSMSATKGMYTPKRWSEFQAWCEICKLTPNMPRALQQSVKAWYVMTCAKILTLMRYSKYHDVQREKYLLHIMRTNVMAIWLIPNNKWQKKIRLLAYTVCPNIIGSIQWKYYQSKGIVNDQ